MAGLHESLVQARFFSTVGIGSLQLGGDGEQFSADLLGLGDAAVVATRIGRNRLIRQSAKGGRQRIAVILKHADTFCHVVELLPDGSGGGGELFHRLSEQVKKEPQPHKNGDLGAQEQGEDKVVHRDLREE
jgi:hypothetical protein